MTHPACDLKDLIRPLYGQLAGLLEQLPTETGKIGPIYANEVVTQQADVIERLKELTGEDYERFKIISRDERNEGELFVHVLALRSQVAGLIGYVGSKYYNDEQKVAAPGTQLVVQQTQTQEQTAVIQLQGEIENLIRRREAEHQEGTKERDFFKQLGQMVSTARSGVEVIAAAVALAEKLGLSLSFLRQVFPF